MKVKLLLPFVGVTVTELAPDEPTDGVIVPPWPPSLIVIVCDPLKVPLPSATVNAIDGEPMTPAGTTGGIAVKVGKSLPRQNASAICGKDTHEIASAAATIDLLKSTIERNNCLDEIICRRACCRMKASSPGHLP